MTTYGLIKHSWISALLGNYLPATKYIYTSTTVSVPLSELGAGPSPGTMGAGRHSNPVPNPDPKVYFGSVSIPDPAKSFGSGSATLPFCDALTSLEKSYLRIKNTSRLFTTLIQILQAYLVLSYGSLLSLSWLRMS